MTAILAYPQAILLSPIKSGVDILLGVALTLNSFEVLLLSLVCVMAIYVGLTRLLNWVTSSQPRSSKSPVNILDIVVFTDFRPEWMVTNDEWRIMAKNRFKMSDEAIEFQSRMLLRSGISDQTNWPPGVSCDPPDFSLASARYEAEIIMFSCIDQLLANNNVKPSDIDVLVVNCSLFNPTPSLCAMIINKYKMRENLVTYNISGMGCSASVLGVQLASDSLRRVNKPHPLAIVVSTEIITPNMYAGDEKAFLLANSLFRMNGSAVMLTLDGKPVKGRPAPRWSIEHLIRVHLARDDDAYNCISQKTDSSGLLGVKLDQTLMKVAHQGIKKNMTILAPKVLPYREQLRYVIRLGLKMFKDWVFPPKPRVRAPSPRGTYSGSSDDEGETNETTSKEKGEARPANTMILPSFKTGLDYFAVHAGGRGVLDAIQNALQLDDEDIQPSRDVLYKYGNTSSCSIWYEVVEIEKTKPVVQGEKLLALAIGSGFKCNTLVLQRL